MLWKVNIKTSELRMVWKKRESAGRDLWPLREGVEGFLLQQLSDGGGPGFLQVIYHVAREA